MIVVQSERKNGPKTMVKLQVNSGVAKFAWWAPCVNINNLESLQTILKDHIGINKWCLYLQVIPKNLSVTSHKTIHAADLWIPQHTMEYNILYNNLQKYYKCLYYMDYISIVIFL